MAKAPKKSSNSGTSNAERRNGKAWKQNKDKALTPEQKAKAEERAAWREKKRDQARANSYATRIAAAEKKQDSYLKVGSPPGV